MDEFFTSRVEGYDEHMLSEVGGCDAGYELMAKLVSELSPKRLLDLGCGTGLELDFIFKLCPDVEVTGIDMTAAMLEKLRNKHPDARLTLICGDYLETDFGEGYGAAVSFETLHHFTRERKLGLYKRLCDSLAPGGVYIECDYMCDTDEQEKWFFDELERQKREQGLDGTLFHFDTPITVSGQIELLRNAGFSKVGQVFREENTVMLRAEK